MIKILLFRKYFNAMSKNRNFPSTAIIATFSQLACMYHHFICAFAIYEAKRIVLTSVKSSI